MKITIKRIERTDLVKNPVRWRVRHPGGTREFRSEHEAETYERRLRRVAAPSERESELGGKTCREVWETWREERVEKWREGTLAGSTVRGDQGKADAFLAVFGRRCIADVLPIEIERWAEKLHSKHKARDPRWANACLIHVRQVFKWARRRRYLALNPLADDPPRLKAEPREERQWVPTWDMVDRLIAFGQQPRPGTREFKRSTWGNLNVAIALQAGAGLRIGEVMALKWENVNFVERLIRVRHSIRANKPGRGLKPEGVPAYFVGPPKRGSKRDVPMNQMVYDAVLAHRDVPEPVGTTRRPRAFDSPFVIRNAVSPDKFVLPSNFTKTLRKFLADASLIPSVKETGDWHSHVLRRFYASARLSLGHRLIEVVENMGHSKPDMTFEHYARALRVPDRGSIWWERYAPASADGPPRIDGQVVSDVALLPSSEAAGMPEWIQEAIGMLKCGRKVDEVARALRRSKGAMKVRFRERGLPTPYSYYREARDARYRELYEAGVAPIDIADQTRTHPMTVADWVRRLERDQIVSAKTLRTKRKQKSVTAVTALEQASLF